MYRQCYIILASPLMWGNKSMSTPTVGCTVTISIKFVSTICIVNLLCWSHWWSYGDILVNHWYGGATWHHRHHCNSLPLLSSPSNMWKSKNGTTSDAGTHATYMHSNTPPTITLSYGMFHFGPDLHKEQQPHGLDLHRDHYPTGWPPLRDHHPISWPQYRDHCPICRWPQ